MIYVSIAVLAAVAVIVFLLGKNRTANRLTPIAILSFVFIMFGIFASGDYGVVGYSLLAVGLLLSFIDMYNRSKSK